MKRHSLDLVSLIFGALFTAAGLLFLISPNPWSLLFESANLSWVFPTLVLLGGAALLFSMAKPNARRSASSPATSPETTDAPDVDEHASPEEQKEQTEESPE